MSREAIEDILAPSVVTLGKASGSKGAAGPQQSFLDGSMLLAKGTGPEKIIRVSTFSNYFGWKGKRERNCLQVKKQRSWQEMRVH